MMRRLTVTVDLDWGDEADLRALREPLMDWVMEHGRIDDDRFKYGVTTELSEGEDDATMSCPLKAKLIERIKMWFWVVWSGGAVDVKDCTIQHDSEDIKRAEGRTVAGTPGAKPAMDWSNGKTGTVPCNGWPRADCPGYDRIKE